MAGNFGIPSIRWCVYCGALKMGVMDWWLPTILSGARAYESHTHDGNDDGILDIGTRTRIYAQWCRRCGSLHIYVYGHDYFSGKWEAWRVPELQSVGGR